jgi:hypothetical protein
MTVSVAIYEREGFMPVVVCLGCLRDREVADERRPGECPGCGDLGYASPLDLARDETFWIEGSRPPMPRLRGRELRAALAAFPFPPIPVPR